MELTIEALLKLIIALIGTATNGKTKIESMLVSPYMKRVQVIIRIKFRPNCLCVYVHDPALDSLLFSLKIRNDFVVESELPQECYNIGFAPDCLWYLTMQLLGRQSHNCTNPPTSELPIMTSEGLAEEMVRLCQNPTVSKKMLGLYRLYVSQLVVLELMCGLRVPCVVVISTNSSSEIKVELYWQTSKGLISFFKLAVTIDVQERLTLHIADLAYANSDDLTELLPKGIGRFVLLFTQELGYALACLQPIESIFITVCSTWHARGDINFRDYELFRDTGKTFYMQYGFCPTTPEAWGCSTGVIPLDKDDFLDKMKTGYYTYYRPANYLIQLPLSDQQVERWCYDKASDMFITKLVDRSTCVNNIENGHLKSWQPLTPVVTEKGPETEVVTEGVGVKRQRPS